MNEIEILRDFFNRLDKAESRHPSLGDLGADTTSALIRARHNLAQLTTRAVDDATRRAFEKAHDRPYGYNSLCGLCNPHRN